MHVSLILRTETVFSRRQLDIIGEMSGESLLQADLGCTTDAVPSSILRSDLQDYHNRRLHIYANIGNPMQIAIFYYYIK